MLIGTFGYGVESSVKAVGGMQRAGDGAITIDPQPHVRAVRRQIQANRITRAIGAAVRIAPGGRRARLARDFDPGLACGLTWARSLADGHVGARAFASRSGVLRSVEFIESYSFDRLILQLDQPMYLR